MGLKTNIFNKKLFIFYSILLCLKDIGMSSIIPVFGISLICWFASFWKWFSFNSSEKEIVVLLTIDGGVTKTRNNSVVVGKAETLSIK